MSDIIDSRPTDATTMRRLGIVILSLCGVALALIAIVVAVSHVG